MNKKLLLILLAIFGIHILFLIKLKFTAWPEMLFWPYLNINGWALYKDIAIAHTPLLIFKLDVFYRIFGVGILQLKMFTWALILLFDLLIYLLTQKLFNKKVALSALVFFAVWQVFYEGNGLWFDLFMGVLAFISFYFVQKKNWMLAGIFWALAFLSKQSAVWFLLPIGLQIIEPKQWVKGLKNIILGSGLIIALFVLAIWFTKLWPGFFNWAIKFGVTQLPMAQGQIQLPDLKNLSIALFPFLIFLPIIFQKQKGSWNLLLWAAAGMMGAYPRFEYFHFQPAVPYLAIASALVLASAWHKKDLVKAFVPVYVIGCLYLFSGFMVRNYNEGIRFYEPEVKTIVNYIKDNTEPGDKIFVMNWWDNIYALTGTFPATNPWVPQLSWYQDLQGIQDKEVTDLSNEKPKLIILNEYSSVGLSSYKPQKVYDYVLSNYKLKENIGGVQILMPR